MIVVNSCKMPSLVLPADQRIVVFRALGRHDEWQISLMPVRFSRSSLLRAFEQVVRQTCSLIFPSARSRGEDPSLI
jgi:hypothetical protein